MGLPEIRQRKFAQSELDAHATHLRYQEGFTLQAIANEMGCSVSTAFARVRRGYAMMPGRTAADQKAADLRELDDIARMAWQIAERPHVMVSNGKVVTMTVETADGTTRTLPVPDDGPSLDAMDRILRVQERRTRYEGNDAPSKRSIEVVSKDAFVSSIEQMNAEMAEAEDAYEGSS